MSCVVSHLPWGPSIAGNVKNVRLHGSEKKVNAEIRRSRNDSEHADQVELINWIVERGLANGGLFLIHGNEDTREIVSDLLINHGVDGDKIFRPPFDETSQIIAGSSAESVSQPKPRVVATQLQRNWHNDYAAIVL